MIAINDLHPSFTASSFFLQHHVPHVPPTLPPDSPPTMSPPHSLSMCTIHRAIAVIEISSFPPQEVDINCNTNLNGCLQ
jgi:hypothetical protein